ncbi:helix-turn-helix transcriptional regulator [Nitrincola sp.]|uniref:helix-turn-helix transcriptional regulator n=1 Tax=Nitrincola sp. TaxID=1926584 RepID=UPI003A8DE39F
MTHSKQFLSDREVAERYSIGRATVWRWITTRKFPTPVKLSPGCTRWRVADLKRWETGEGLAA